MEMELISHRDYYFFLSITAVQTILIELDINEVETTQTRI